MVTVAIRVVSIEAFTAAPVHVVVISVLTATANAKTAALNTAILVTMHRPSALSFSRIGIARTILMHSSGVTTGGRSIAIVVLWLLVRQPVG